MRAWNEGSARSNGTQDRQLILKSYERLQVVFKTFSHRYIDGAGYLAFRQSRFAKPRFASTLTYTSLAYSSL